MAGIKVNGVAYNWAMVEIASPGLTGNSNVNDPILHGVSELKWSRRRELKNNYGLGGNLSSRGYGNKVCEASIVMDYDTQVQLRNGLASLADIGEFDLVISFAGVATQTEISAQGLSPDENGGNWTTETITLKGCVFTEDGMESKVDDENITKEFQLNPRDIIIA